MTLRCTHLACGTREWRRGFTLVELLVVVAILALLISILTPSLQRSVDLTRRTVCAGNTHQIASAFTAYAARYNGYFPSAVSDWPGNNHVAIAGANGAHWSSLYVCGARLAQELGELGLADGPVNEGSGSYILPESQRPDTPYDCPATEWKPRLHGYPWNRAQNYFNPDEYMFLTNLRGRGPFLGTTSPRRTCDPTGPIVSDRTLIWDSSYPAPAYATNHRDAAGVMTGQNQAWSDGSAAWIGGQEFVDPDENLQWLAWTAHWYWVEYRR